MKKHKNIFVFILAFLFLISAEYVRGMSGDFGPYYGTGIFSFRPESLAVFVLSLIMLGRFTRPDVLKDRSRMISSALLGILLGFCSVWGQYVLYEVTLFDKASKVLTAILLSAGFSVFTIPLVSEIIGFSEMISSKLFDANEESPLIKKRLIYFIVVSLITFITYIPLFLYMWPMNFFGDSYDELLAQLAGHRTTHHTVIHGLMLRKFYELGLKMGAPEYGFQLMTLLQMALLAVSVGVFMLYVYDKGYSKKVRVAFFILCVINPVNGYYAVTAEKGTMGIALALIGMTYLLKLLDTEEENDMRRKISYAAVFVVSSSLGCLFRNNMVYAFLLGGIVIAILRKDVKKKLIMLLTVLILFGAYHVENNTLIKAEGSVTNDQYRETFPLPIMCLARVAILHGSEMDPVLYETILAYIPQRALDEYTISISDGVKGLANEALLKADTKTFIKIFIKCGLKYPGDYIDQFAWLTHGYWNPYDAFILGSTTPYVVKPLPEEYADVTSKNLIPAFEGVFNAVYYDTGRFRIPLIAWFFRSTIYVWSVVFLVICGIVRKSRRMLSIGAIPFFYLVTVLAGPLCQFRYVYFNVLTLPIVLLAFVEGYGKRQKK